MPVNNKHTTSGQTQVRPPLLLPGQAEFGQHLKELARSGLRILLEDVMNEELTALLGASWGEHTTTRIGYRNGFYTRDLGTTAGVIEDLAVPRDREGKFHSQVFERFARYEPQVEEGLRDMFVAGVSTAKVGPVAEQLIEVAPSKSAVSRLNADLEAQFKEWRERSLATRYKVIYADGIYYEVRHGEVADHMVVLAAMGVDLQGDKQILGLRLSAEESKEGWLALLADLRKRGVEQVELAVTDGNEGLIAALKEAFPATPRQRCVVHKHRNVVAALPRRVRGQIGAELDAIWQQPDKDNAKVMLEAFKLRYATRYPEAVASLVEAEVETLTFYDFPQLMWRYIRTTNAIESTFSVVRQRTDLMDVFTNEDSCLMLVWASLKGITFQRIPVRPATS
jgi:transposase-like protein